MKKTVRFFFHCLPTTNSHKLLILITFWQRQFLQLAANLFHLCQTWDFLWWFIQVVSKLFLCQISWNSKEWILWNWHVSTKALSLNNYSSSYCACAAFSWVCQFLSFENKQRANQWICGFLPFYCNLSFH